MGMMPSDRELKWQRVFRRFGLPGSVPEKAAGTKTENQQREGSQKRDGENDKPMKSKTGR